MAQSGAESKREQSKSQKHNVDMRKALRKNGEKAKFPKGMADTRTTKLAKPSNFTAEEKEITSSPERASSSTFIGIKTTKHKEKP